MELRKIKYEGEKEEICPIISSREQTTCVDIINEKHAIIGSMIDNLETTPSRNTLKTFTMIKATRYVKPNYKFKILKNKRKIYKRYSQFWQYPTQSKG